MAVVNIGSFIAAKERFDIAGVSNEGVLICVPRGTVRHIQNELVPRLQGEPEEPLWTHIMGFRVMEGPE